MQTQAALNLSLSQLVDQLYFVAPEIVLAVWGLLVVLVDLVLARRSSPSVRRRTIGYLAMAGAGLGLLAALAVWLLPLDTDPVIFYGTIAGDMQTGMFNIIYTGLLLLVVGMSMSWSFSGWSGPTGRKRSFENLFSDMSHLPSASLVSPIELWLWPGW